MLAAMRNPDLFHGWGRKRDYFEGWYFKLVNAAADYSVAFIPGILLGRGPADSHSFVQIVDGVRASLSYVRFPTGAFRAERRSLAIAVQDSSFSLERLTLNIASQGAAVFGTVSFRNVKRWPDSAINPGSMGFYNYLPRMQCYSQVCAMDMDLAGELEINGLKVDFSGGRGYVEKNWGRAFPYGWIWIQSNSFGDRRASLSCSLGHIPLPWGSFRGHLVGLLVGDRFYSFTSMNKTAVRIVRSGSDVAIELSNSRHSLRLDVATDPSKFVQLEGPRDGRMVALVQENLMGRVAVTLRATKGDELLFAGEGRCAGVEYGGDQMLVLDQHEQQ